MSELFNINLHYLFVHILVYNKHLPVAELSGLRC